MRTIKPDSQSGRLLRVLADGRWHGGPQDFGNDFHRAAARIYDLRRFGFPCEGRRRDGKPWHEYRISDPAVVYRAARLVRQWDARRWSSEPQAALAAFRDEEAG